MDLKIITPIFTIGKLLALTPSTTKNLSPTSFQKLYSILVFLFYICGTTLSFVNRKSHYSKLSVMQLVLRVLLDVDLFVHSFYTVIVVGLFKRHQWIIIITKLETVQYENDNERRYYSTFVVSHLVLLLMTVFAFYVWIDFFGVDFLQLYLVEYLQMYSQFFYTLSACTILKMILSRYRHQNIAVTQKLKSGKQLSAPILYQIKRNLLVLRQIVDIFNDVFGWTVLLNVFFGALRSLIYLDVALKGDDSFNSDNHFENSLQILSHVGVILFYWVSVLFCI
jgi:hypothetical protein